MPAERLDTRLCWARHAYSAAWRRRELQSLVARTSRKALQWRRAAVLRRRAVQ